MKIMIIYATNSGSTYLVAEYITQQLQPDHQVTLKNVESASGQDLLESDLVLLGSNSWDWQRLEGQPHHTFLAFLDQNKSIDLQQRTFALFGCGDRTYQYFCGALDVIGKFVTEHNGKLQDEPLKIDRFFFHDQQQTFHTVSDWVRRLPLTKG